MILNDSQYKAVHSESKLVSVVAGAGAGKTRVLVEAIVNLINKGVDPHKILAITFTKKAAREARDRVQNDRVIVCTIHSWCMKILRQYNKKLTIWDDDDVGRALKVILKRHNMKYEADIKSSIDYSVNVMKPIPPAIQHIYKEYRSYMEHCNAVDFTHMLQVTYEMLKEEHIRVCLQDTYQYVLVDEYQDVSKIQHEIIMAMKGKYLFAGD